MTRRNGKKAKQEPQQKETVGSQFFMNQIEKLVFNSMNDKRRLAEEKRASIATELEMAQMLQDQLQGMLVSRLGIKDGVNFTMRPDGSVVVMDGGKHE